MNYISAFSDVVSQSMFCRALGWTVLHSIWQGALLGLLGAFLLKKKRTLSSISRYRMALLLLFTMLDFAVGTFIYYYQQSKNITNVSNFEPPVLLSPENGDTASAQQIFQTETTIIFADALSFVESHLAWVVIFWALGVLFLGLRLASGLRFIHKLRTQVQPIADDFATWLDMLENLKAKLNITQKIGLRESAFIKSPTALGWLQPMILMPIGLLNALSPSEVEAILAHELAHIKAKDYLVNILQSVIEILFYYHPVVWWLSNIIREERENRCDDWAVALCGNPILYAKTLLKAQTFAPTQHLNILGNFIATKTLAMNFANEPKKVLLERIKRILIPSKYQNIDHQNNISDGSIMKKLTAISLLAATAIGVLIAFSPYAAPRKQVINSLLETPEPLSNLTANQTQTITANPNNGSSTIAAVQGNNTPQPTTLATPTAGNNHAPIVNNDIHNRLKNVLGAESANEVYGNLEDKNNIASMDISRDNNGKSVLVHIRRLNGSVHNIRVDTVENAALAVAPVYHQPVASNNYSETTWTTERRSGSEPNHTSISQLDEVQAFLKKRKILKNDNTHHIKMSPQGLWIDGVQQSADLYKECLAKVECKNCNLELTVGEQ